MTRRDKYAVQFNAGSDARIAGKPPELVPEELSYEMALAWLAGWKDVDRNWGACRPARKLPQV